MAPDAVTSSHGRRCSAAAFSDSESVFIHSSNSF